MAQDRPLNRRIQAAVDVPVFTETMLMAVRGPVRPLMFERAARVLVTVGRTRDGVAQGLRPPEVA